MRSFTIVLVILPLLIPMICMGAAAAPQAPNIVFIMGESVASSAYFFGKKAPIPIPNLQYLMRNGVSFPHTYAAAPVCNPSRATTITGRHAHKLGHMQLSPNTGLFVNGSWNNYEGLDPHENNTFFNFTKKYADYTYKYFGKVDWTAGLHSLSCRVTAWCNKVNFPYTVDPNGYNQGWGWYDEDGATYSDKNCNEAGPNCTKHPNDWAAVQNAADWIQASVKNNPKQPFLAYWGSTIVHPPYGTTTYWLKTVDQSSIIAPEWIDADKLHPEDYQSSMKKKMFNHSITDDFKKIIRAHYYANVAEYDSMIGVLIDAVIAAGVLNNTWFIATSDHGDMNMEHQQFYKMVFYDSSARVPSIIMGGNNFAMNRNIIRNDVISSLLDYFPTMMDMAGIDMNKSSEGVELDGFSLMPFVVNSSNGFVEDLSDRSHTEAKVYDEYEYIVDRPNYVMSQFHGDEIHLSWFLLRQNAYKYVTYGSGQEVAPRLFNIVLDPDEMDDLATNESYSQMIDDMDKMLREVIDYPAVASNVESYNKDSFMLWRDSMNETEYNLTMSRQIRWSKSWQYNSDSCFEAVNAWLKTPNDTFLWAFPQK